MKTLVIITTYNRQEYLDELLPHLKRDDLEVRVYDDGSTPAPRVPSWVNLRRMKHHGRENYGALVRRAHIAAALSGFDRIAMIPDDVLPAVPDPFAEAESIWQEVASVDPHIACLGMLVDKRGHCPQWGSHYPVKVTPRAWHTGWNDLCFYGTPRTVSLSRKLYPPPSPHVLGSMAGFVFTERVRTLGNIYNVADTLWHHRDGPSRMCPEEREANPL